MAATETGSKAARELDRLYRTHVAEVYRYAYALLGNRADAEDVAQTTFVNALRALERGERPRRPSNWLITIAHNIVRQRYRQQQARPAEVELDSDRVEAQPADESGPTMDELVRGMQRLPATQREALVLREFEDRTYKEIQQALGLTAAAVETLLFRARRSLAEELDNLVTCERAEMAMSKQADGRLSRKERRRLDAHLQECPSCAQLAAKHAKYRRAFKGLALLPLPLSLTLFKGAPSASAAAALPTIGAGGAAAVGGASVGAAGGAAGGLMAGGAITKIAVVVAAFSVAGGVGYEGVKQVQQHTSRDRPVKTRGPAADPAARPAATGGPARHGTSQSNGKGLGHTRGRAHPPTRHGRPPTTAASTNTTAHGAKKAAKTPGASSPTVTSPNVGNRANAGAGARPATTKAKNRRQR